MNRTYTSNNNNSVLTFFIDTIVGKGVCLLEKPVLEGLTHVPSVVKVIVFKWINKMLLKKIC